MRIRVSRRIEPPGLASRIKSFLIPLLLVFLVYAVILQAWNVSLIDVLRIMGEQLIGKSTLQRVIMVSMPILFPSLGLVVAFKAGVWNIGAEGQLLLGMVGATWIALVLGAGPATLPTMMLVSAAMGALWALPPGALRGLLGVNEVLTTLMLNYIAAFLLNYLVEGPWRDPHGYGFIKTREFPSGARISLTGILVLAAVSVALVAALMRYTRLGFYLKVLGIGSRTAAYAGASPPRMVVAAMLVSGALAGIGGMVVVSGITGMLMDAGRMSPGYGYTAIIAAWLARLDPLAVVLSSLFLGLVVESGFALQSSLGLNVGSTMLLEGLLLLAAAATRLLEEYEVRLEK